MSAPYTTFGGIVYPSRLAMLDAMVAAWLQNGTVPDEARTGDTLAAAMIIEWRLNQPSNIADLGSPTMMVRDGYTGDDLAAAFERRILSDRLPADVDTSDIPEADEAWFKRAAAVLARNRETATEGAPPMNAETVDITTSIICHEYARLHCMAREMRASGMAARVAFSGVLLGTARFLYDHAPAYAREHLDAVKRVLEIDPDVVVADVVLMRASVHLP